MTAPAGGRIVTTFLAAIAMMLTAPAASAALEAAAADPAALGLGGGQPAWSDEARLPVDGLCVVGGPRAAGITAVAARVEGLPELRAPAVAAWLVRGAWRVAVRGHDRGVPGYHEGELQLDLVRPAAKAGQIGWGVSMGAGGWRAAAGDSPEGIPPVPASGGAGWLVGVALGGRIGSDIALAARWLSRGGGLTGQASERVDLGATLQLAPGWRLGAALDAGAAGQVWRLQAGLECALGRRVALRGGVRPADGAVSLGLGAAVGPVRVDIGRRTHPRLGAWTAIGITTGGGPGRAGTHAS